MNSTIEAPTIRPRHRDLCAEVTGVRAQDIDRMWPQLHRAFLDHHALLFRNLELDEDQFVSLARRFGDIEERYVMKRVDGRPATAVHFIQNLDADGKPVANPYGNANFFWHTDKQYLETPSLITMLQAVELPPAGGNTELADMTAAYEALPEQTRNLIDGLKAVYSYPYMIRTCLNREPTDEEVAKAPPMVHPLVRTHPETGRKSLFVGMYCSEIVGMPLEEERALIAQLNEHAISAPFVYSHPWQPGDVLLWDNRCLLHRGVRHADMGKYRRVLRRTVIQGDKPF